MIGGAHYKEHSLQVFIQIQIGAVSSNLIIVHQLLTSIESRTGEHCTRQRMHPGMEDLLRIVSTPDKGGEGEEGIFDSEEEASEAEEGDADDDEDADDDSDADDDDEAGAAIDAAAAAARPAGAPANEVIREIHPIHF